MFGGDQGEWVYNRLSPLPCEYVVPKEKQDPEILDKMCKEIPAIIPEALKHLKTLIDNNYKFTMPDECKTIRAMYRRENDSVTGWVHECCYRVSAVLATQGKPDADQTAITAVHEWTINKRNRPTITNLYNAYCHWCKANNLHYVKSNVFSKQIEREYGGKEKVAAGMCFKDLCLKPEYANTLDSYWN